MGLHDTVWTKKNPNDRNKSEDMQTYNKTMSYTAETKAERMIIEDSINDNIEISLHNIAKYSKDHRK